jgi:hypothetical protein
MFVSGASSPSRVRSALGESRCRDNLPGLRIRAFAESGGTDIDHRVPAQRSRCWGLHKVPWSWWGQVLSTGISLLTKAPLIRTRTQLLHLTSTSWSTSGNRRSRREETLILCRNPLKSEPPHVGFYKPKPLSKHALNPVEPHRRAYRVAVRDLSCALDPRNVGDHRQPCTKVTACSSSGSAYDCPVL